MSPMSFAAEISAFNIAARHADSPAVNWTPEQTYECARQIPRRLVPVMAQRIIRQALVIIVGENPELFGNRRPRNIIPEAPAVDIAAPRADSPTVDCIRSLEQAHETEEMRTVHIYGIPHMFVPVMVQNLINQVLVKIVDENADLFDYRNIVPEVVFYEEFVRPAGPWSEQPSRVLRVVLRHRRTADAFRRNFNDKVRRTNMLLADAEAVSSANCW